MKQTRHGVNVSASQEYAGDGRASRPLRRSKLRRGKNLRAQVGRSVQQKPFFGVYGKGELRLGARVSAKRSRAQGKAVGTRAVPLGKTAPGRRAEDLNAHSRLKLGVSVGANFAVQVDFFVLRGNPFHGLNSFY